MTWRGKTGWPLQFYCIDCQAKQCAASFEFNFHGRTCCEYVIADENPISSKQTMLLHGYSKPSLGIYHWSWYAGSED